MLSIATRGLMLRFLHGQNSIQVKINFDPMENARFRNPNCNWLFYTMAHVSVSSIAQTRQRALISPISRHEQEPLCLVEPVFFSSQLIGFTLLFRKEEKKK